MCTFVVKLKLCRNLFHVSLSRTAKCNITYLFYSVHSKYVTVDSARKFVVMSVVIFRVGDGTDGVYRIGRPNYSVFSR